MGAYRPWGLDKEEGLLRIFIYAYICECADFYAAIVYFGLGIFFGVYFFFLSGPAQASSMCS